MRCGEQEKTANSPLRRLNSLHHQQHFINNRRLAEQKESSPQTQMDARTIVLLLHSERLQDIQENLYTPQPRNKPPTRTAFLRVGLHRSHYILWNCYHVSTITVFFLGDLNAAYRLSLETHIKHASSSPRVIAAASPWPALLPRSARRIWRCPHLQMDEESLQGGQDLWGFCGGNHGR